MAEEEFDPLKAFASTEGRSPATAPAQPARRRKDKFVQISREQLAILRKGRASAAAWNVFLEILWLDFDEGGEPIKFTNQALDNLGISHDSKTRALRELEKLGLIKIENRPGRRSPIIILSRR